MHARQQGAESVIVVAGDHHAVKRHAVHELDEGALDVVHVAIAVHVLAVDVGDHREDGRELEERAVAFVGFGDQVLRLAQARVGAHGVHAAADDHGGVEPAGGEHGGDHRGGGGLAVHAGDGDAVLQAHQFGQHLGARNDGDVGGARGGDLGIVGANRRAGDDHLGAGDVLGAVAFEDDGAEGGQALR